MNSSKIKIRKGRGNKYKPKTGEKIFLMFFCTTPKSLERDNRDLEFSNRVFGGRERERKEGKLKTFEELRSHREI